MDEWIGGLMGGGQAMKNATNKQSAVVGAATVRLVMTP
jgi:hypothetical protein